jgi:redox-sensitive bicupin YhaK (pirin superfamily)
MMNVRRAQERGHTQLSWLDSWHTFSFGEYTDPRHMGFRTLRVINDDRVAPGGGFATHGHRDMEIITYVLDGALAHKDSLGTGSVIRPGEAQRMSAGTGILHSEFNHSQTDPVHFLQIWILPERTGLAPGYEQRSIPAAEKRGRLRLIASPDGRDGSVTVCQAVQVYATLLEPGNQVTHPLPPSPHAWVHVARGAVELNGQHLGEGDGAAISGETALTLASTASAEVLLFELA